MSAESHDTAPLRVAVIGAGPAGFYTVQHLFNKEGLNVRIDMFDRLPTPFGLVRHGVAPDHEKIKSVVAVYHKLAQRPGYRFFGNVEFGRDLSLDDLRQHYHQIVFCTGAQTDRRLGVPGEDLEGSHPATEFVAWYNGHPDYSHLEFDFDCTSAVVVGVGNVAVDVARILCRTTDELARTDIADYALEALAHSRIRDVYLLGRRGPAQAAFTNPEVKELGALPGACARTLPDEMQLDPVTREALESAPDRTTQRKIDILNGLVDRREDKPRTLHIRFLVSPVEILADGGNRMRAVRVARNELYADGGRIRSRTTEEVEEIPAGLVFRSVGYRGVPLPGLPFHEQWGLVPNERGRVVDADGETLTGLFVSGWIKRGPSGVIGTNKPDAGETVATMLEQREAGRLGEPTEPAPEAVERKLDGRRVRYVTYADWMRLDALETERGKAQGRPRIKLTDHRAFAEALSG